MPIDLIHFLGACIVVLCATLVWFATAPLGYQDENGFHLGEDPRDKINN